MKYYHSYMDRQEISPERHEALMNLNVERRTPRRGWVKCGALAACAALILGVGAWRLAPGLAPGPQGGLLAAGNTLKPAQAAETDVPQTGGDQPGTGTEDISSLQPPERGFVVNSPVDGGSPMAFFYMPGFSFRDMTGAPGVGASRAFTPGAFTVDLTLEDVQKIFWGPEGIPETYSTEIGRQDLPWALFWDGYTLQGRAWYDGQGQFTELTIWGEKGRAGFTLELRLGALPFTCCVEMNRGDEVEEFLGVQIASWSKTYDRDGDGQTDYICGSEFMTENDIGVRFVSQNNGTAEQGVDGESWFNTLFIRQAVPGGLHLDHLLTAADVPAWRYETFDTLEQARQEVEFAPYLPAAEPEGYSAYTGNKEFSGRLSYQEGHENTLHVRWTRGYDNVEVDVYRDGYRSCTLADPDNPASYDLRLYDIPWSETVPEEYRETVNRPAFRAEDMSLAIVEARGREKDTGGMQFHFEVLHPDGTLVAYRCDGMTAGQVWAMVEETLR